MRKGRITRESVLCAAAEIVKEAGVSALNARAVAKQLGASTQPVYSLFTGMEELKAALLEEGKARYRRFIEGYFLQSKSKYESYGMGFVKFAREERGFYRMLFLESPPGADPFLEEILAEMVGFYRMPEETARAFHRDMSVFSFGLASMVSAGAALSEAEIDAALSRQFYALYALYFPTRPRFWEGS